MVRRTAQSIVNTMAAANGPDVVGLLADDVSYGAYGDHGSASEEVQRVPMVFWSPSIAYSNHTGARFTTPDVMPTTLRAMGIRTGRMTGRQSAFADHCRHALCPQTTWTLTPLIRAWDTR